MKSIVAVITLCFVATAVGDNLEDKLTFGQVMAYERTCIAETGVEIDALLKIKSGEQVVFDDKVKCYMGCLLKKMGVIKDDDTLDEDVIRFKVLEGLPQDEVDQLINACKDQVGKDSCETGGMILECSLDNYPLLFLN